jgi:hypothetical protein
MWGGAARKHVAVPCNSNQRMAVKLPLLAALGSVGHSVCPVPLCGQWHAVIQHVDLASVFSQLFATVMNFVG